MLRQVKTQTQNLNLMIDSELSDLDDIEVMDGDFVVVKVPGKARVVNYTERIDVIDGRNMKVYFTE